MVAGAETVATATDKQQNEQDEEKIDAWMMCECLRMNRGLKRKRTSGKNKSCLYAMRPPRRDIHLSETRKEGAALQEVTCDKAFLSVYPISMTDADAVNHG